MDTDAIMREMQASFRIEAEELVTELEESLLQLESDSGNAPLIDCVFRSLHTLKGSGSSAGFLKLAAFLHIFEDAFNLAREGKMEVTQDLIDISLQTVDKITEYMAEEPTENFDKAAIQQDPILVELRKIMPNSAKSIATADDVAAETASAKEIGIYKISYKPFENFMEFGNEPISVLDELRGVGTLTATATSTIPKLDAFDAETTYLSWNMELVSDANEEDIQEIFSFVEMDAEIKIEREARTFDEVSNVEGLFDATTLEDYKAESLELIASIEKSLTPSIDAEGNKAQWKVIERGFHSFKGNSGILVSSASKDVAANHPLRHLEVLSEAGQFFSSESHDEAILAGDENRYKIVESLLETVREHYQAFFNCYRPNTPESKLLSSIELDPQLFKAETKAKEEELSPIEEAFRNMFSQGLAMIEGSVESIGETTLSSEYSIIKRAFGNIKRAAAGAEKKPLSELCETFERESKTQVEKGHDSFKAYCTVILEQIKDAAKKTKPDKESEPSASEKTATANKPAAKAAPPAGKPTIRVDEEKIDRLMRAIGELLVARGAFPLIAKNLADNHGLGSIAQELRESGSNVSRLADELQGAVMSIRMRPLQSLFQRFPRMIRDIAKKLDKNINFVTIGEDTELDKAMVEQLGDPLVHIIRNSLDHGIETADERALTDKPKNATITLEAVTEGATVAINIRDDGRGLNPEKLKIKALEKGLITQDEADSMPDSVAHELIMKAGFSTAEAVTDLSGRGVGMDVVANNIHKIHGTVEIVSEFGTGTTITFRLPTSLLISKAILIKSATEEYLIPMDNVASLEKIPSEDIRTHCGTQIVNIRGQIINLVDLRELLSCPRDEKIEPVSEQLSVALITTPEGQLGLIVDKFLNQEEIVVKPLAGELGDVLLFSGVSIMGDGRVVPVINAREINNYYLKNTQRAAAAMSAN